MRRRPLGMACLGMILLIYLGIRLSAASPSDFGEWEGEYVTLEGRVYQKEIIDRTEKKQQILYLTLTGWPDAKIQDNEQEKRLWHEKQNVVCYLRAGQKLPEMGSTVRVRGSVKCFEKASNPGQFDAASYYHILKISFQLNQTEIQAKTITYDRIGEALYRFCAESGVILDRLLPKREASLMKTMLLGEKRAADKELKALYQRNGIAHLLAISGVYALSLVYITLCKMPIFCPFWAF